MTKKIAGVAVAGFALLAGITAFTVFRFEPHHIFAAGVVFAAGAQPNQSQGSSFTGAWCAQGDSAKRCSISSNGVFFNLTNENGDTSTGNLRDPNHIVAPGWQFVTGTLSPDGTQINWSNGTFWARCYSGGGYGVNLSGAWYAQGNRSLNCSIRQRGSRIWLTNEQGSNATGHFDGGRHITTYWNGRTIGGTIHHHGDRIDWDNGTYWVRYRRY